MSAFPSNSQKRAKLIQRMTELGLDEADIEETFTHDVYNTTARTGVLLLHRPSGLNVRCQATTNREQNRFLARQLLADKIERNEKYFGSPRRAKHVSLVLAIILFAIIIILAAIFSRKGFFEP
jgi:peptide chain release factor